jgi:Glutaminase
MEEKETRSAAPNPADPEGREIHLTPLSPGMQAAVARLQAGQQPQASRTTVATKAPEPPMEPLVSIDQLAERIYKAMDGPGTDEEQIYLALQQVRGHAAAIQQLKEAYACKYNTSLLEALEDDLDEDELAYAMRLLCGDGGRADGGSADPATRLHDLLGGKSVQPEQVFACLDAVSRDAVAARALQKIYHDRYGKNLLNVLKDALGEDSTELQLVRHMLGGTAMQANVEQQELSPDQAQALFKDLARLKFVSTQEQKMGVPFRFPVDGCHLRAHLMSQRLTQLGYASRKVFAVARSDAGLAVPTPYAGDRKAGEQPHVEWVFHVAPVVEVMMDGGRTELRVLDPAIASGPIPVSVWTRLMNPGDFKLMDSASATGLILGNRSDEGVGVGDGHIPPEKRQVPRGMNVAFVAPRDMIEPADLVDPRTPESAQNYMENQRGALTDYARAARAHEMAAFLRQEIASPAPSAAKIIQMLRSTARDARLIFLAGLGSGMGSFPALWLEVRSRFNIAEWQALQAAMDAK